MAKPRFAKRHKFGAVATKRDGHNFPSKLEASYYDQLKLRVRAGEVVFFLMQVPFHLPGGVKYVVDFQEFWADGTVHFVDTKGAETSDFKVKKRMVEALYPAQIEVVKNVR